MTSPDADWIPFHQDHYLNMAHALDNDALPASLTDFIWSYAPTFFHKVFGVSEIFMKNEAGALKLKVPNDGDEVVFWDGSTLELAKFDEIGFWLSDFFSVAETITDFSQRIGHQRPTVIDLGAGSCIQSVILRETGFQGKIFNFDCLKRALAVGERIAKRYDLKDILFGHVDLSGVLQSKEKSAALREDILGHADGAPVIVISRYAIHPFFSIPEYERLFDFLLNDLEAKAGIHLEMCGNHTDDYKTIVSLSNNPAIRVANKLRNEKGDPLSYLAAHPAITPITRYGVWPHYLFTRFPSYLSWVRKA